MLQIRLIKESDVVPLIDLAQELLDGTKYAAIPFSYAATKHTLMQMITRPKDWCGFVAMVDDKPVGFIGGYLSLYPFSTWYALYDIVFVVHPKHRSYRVAAGLIQAYKQWATDHKAHTAHLHVSHDPTGRIGKLLKRLGFDSGGTRYVRR